MRKRGFLHLVFLSLSTAAAMAQPGEVSLTAPADNSSSVAVTPAFSWSPVDGAASYEIEVARRSNMKQVELDVSDLAVTSFVPESPLSESLTYYWRVRGTDAAAKTGSWSNIWSFTTGQLPNATALSSPANQEENVSLSPELAWTETNGATSYDVDLSLQSDFTPLLFNQSGIAQTSLMLPIVLDPDTRYYWRVRGSNGVGDGPYSSTRWFNTIVSSPSQVSLLSPSDGATEVNTKPAFSWAAASGADSYTLEVSGTSGFAALLLQEADITSTSFTPSTPFVNGSILYWRVRASNVAGDGPDSSVRHFTTVIGGATQVQLISPLDQAVGVIVKPTLTWNSVSGATNYRVQLSKQSDFSSELIYNTVVGGTQFQTGSLDYDQKYFWRVRASNAGSENWSPVRNFVTETGAPGQVILDSPADDAVDQPLQSTLSWSTSTLAETYNLQVGLDAEFSVVLVSETGMTTTSYDLEALDPSTEYYWRVQAENTKGEGPWSAERKFTTRMLQTPAAPVLIYPPDAAAGVSVNPVFSWNVAEGADSYKLELSTEPPDEFENFVTIVTAVVVTQPFFQAPQLTSGREHYWRVEARNAEGSAPSPIWRFRTELTTASESDEIPAAFDLHQNYPNPFNPSTAIRYDLPEPSNVRVTVFDALGRFVESLVDGHQSTGRYSVTWNAKDVPSGVYIVRLEAGTFSASRPMLLVR